MRNFIGEVKAIVQRSVSERGAFDTVKRVVTHGPVYVAQLVGDLRERATPVSEFDRQYGVDTRGGARGDRIHLRDLRIASPNWVDGVDYIPVEPPRFHLALQSVGVSFEGFTFIDYGSGKGRAIMLASDYPFARLIGIDFAEELIATAKRNWAVYRSPRQRCTHAEFVHEDFVAFDIPREPSILYFYNPCNDALMPRVVAKVTADVAKNGQPVAIVYVNSLYSHHWKAAGFRLLTSSEEPRFDVWVNAFWPEKRAGTGASPSLAS